MSITKTLTDKDLSADAKLESVAETVATARDAYGNTDAEIAVPRVNTTNGNMPFNMLEAEGKVEVLRDVVASIKAQAIEYSEQNPGTVLNKKIEELIATNGFFANVAPGTKFSYI